MGNNRDLQELEEFITNFYAPELKHATPQKNNQKLKTKDTSTAVNIASMIQNQDLMNKYSQVISEDISMFQRLKWENLQGSTKQKHGDASEVMAVRNFNKEQILSGSNQRMELSQSKIDPLTDVLIRNGDGQVIHRGQIKFYNSADKTFEALNNPKYMANDIKYVPADQLEDVIRIAKEKSKMWKAEAKQLRKNGDIEGANRKLEQAKNAEHTAHVTQSTGNTYAESKKSSANKFSRVEVTTKTVLKDANSAGIEGAKSAAALSAGISGATNLKKVIDGEKEISEAVIDTAIDTAKASAMSYAVTYSSTVIQAGAKQAGTKIGSNALQNLGKSAKGPTLIVTSTIEVSKSVKKFIDGDLDASGLFNELGEKGVGILCAEGGAVIGTAAGTAVGATIGGLIGTFTLPGLGTVGGAVFGAKVGAVAGSMIGSMVGYFVGTQIYQSVGKLISLYDGEKYRRAKALYEAAYERMKQERLVMERQLQEHFTESNQHFINCFKAIEEAALNNNIQAISTNLDAIVNRFGETLQFQTFDEFDDFMMDDSSILKL